MRCFWLSLDIDAPELCALAAWVLQETEVSDAYSSESYLKWRRNQLTELDERQVLRPNSFQVPSNLENLCFLKIHRPHALRLPLVGGGQGTKLLLAQAAKKVLWASLPTQVVRFDRVQGSALLREAACV